jgi:hypothetical protein
LYKLLPLIPKPLRQPKNQGGDKVEGSLEGSGSTQSPRPAEFEEEPRAFFFLNNTLKFDAEQTIYNQNSPPTRLNEPLVSVKVEIQWLHIARAEMHSERAATTKLTVCSTTWPQGYTIVAMNRHTSPHHLQIVSAHNGRRGIVRRLLHLN